MLLFFEDIGILELLYNWNAVVTLLLGLLIDVIIGFSTGKKKRIVVPIICISIFTICLSILIVQAKRYYTYVPENLWEDMPFREAQSRLINCDLRCSDENIQWDLKAKEKLTEGVSPDSISFRVKSIDPAPGTFLKKNSDVTLIVTWKPYSISDGDIKRSKTEDQKEQVIILEASNTPSESVDTHDNPYPDFDPSLCYPFNATEFSLIVEERAVKILTEGGEEWSLGSVPASPASMQVDLIDYYSGVTVDSKMAYIGDTVHFFEIPDGVYYFEVKSEGYKTGISGAPFALKNDSSKEKDVLPWITYLEKNDISYSQRFRVQMKQSTHSIEPYTETTISVKKNKTMLGSYYPAYINEDGFLTLWMGINGVDYYFVADFYVADGYTLTVSNHNNQYIDASNTINGICILEF